MMHWKEDIYMLKEIKESRNISMHIKNVDTKQI